MALDADAAEEEEVRKADATEGGNGDHIIVSAACASLGSSEPSCVPRVI